MMGHRNSPHATHEMNMIRVALLSRSLRFRNRNEQQLWSYGHSVYATDTSMEAPARLQFDGIQSL